jgi:hypothetical protein
LSIAARVGRLRTLAGFGHPAAVVPDPTDMNRLLRARLFLKI